MKFNGIVRLLEDTDDEDFFSAVSDVEKEVLPIYVGWVVLVRHNIALHVYITIGVTNLMEIRQLSPGAHGELGYPMIRRIEEFKTAGRLYITRETKDNYYLATYDKNEYNEFIDKWKSYAKKNDLNVRITDQSQQI